MVLKNVPLFISPLYTCPLYNIILSRLIFPIGNIQVPNQQIVNASLFMFVNTSDCVIVTRYKTSKEISISAEYTVPLHWKTKQMYHSSYTLRYSTC